MIKLNNKNITYVALADSNNSIKAPKEIWYADSNNSVKLVYRRKDALIEGEDYEKYHFVKGDGTAYIRTNHTLNENLDWEVKVANFTDYKCLFWQRNGEVANNLNTVLVKAVNYFPGLRVGNKSSEVRINPFSDTEITVSTSNDTVTINGQTYQVTKGTSTISGNFALFYTEFTLDSTTQDVKCAYFRFLDSNRNYIQNLIPCKLLKPVPKWLDANGIRRQVGECGMIDLVSGKFYGNVNSVGTFTVENYYERKEWLVGDGSAYIDTLHLANEGLGWETHVSNLSFKKYFVWNRVVAAECPAIVLYHSIAHNGTVRVQNNYTDAIVLQNQTDYDYTVAINSNGAVVNGVQYIGQLASENISNKSIKLFYCDINEESKINTIIPNGGNSQDVKCSYFRFLDSNMNYIQNLIPCTLTMDLPASMDANNIARTKGTSGMWDLVSDRFYGNVANSGTFKAVNLAEGVDYEVHQWLVGDGSAYIDTGIKLTEADVITTKIIATTIPSGGSTDYYIVYGNNSGTAYNTVCALFGNSLMLFRPTKTNDITFQIRYYVDTEYEIVQSNTSIDINNQQVWQGSSIFESIDWNCLIFASVNTQLHNFNGKIAYFLISDKINLIPVKLIRPIPSKYDANGIARQVGECGMYDTVNDVFYGNVASSGTFSVSDDS